LRERAQKVEDVGMYHKQVVSFI